MYKTVLPICVLVFILIGCADADKKTGQIYDNINNEDQAGDNEGFISSGDEGVFLEGTGIVIEGNAVNETTSTGQVSLENPLNF